MTRKKLSLSKSGKKLCVSFVLRFTTITVLTAMLSFQMYIFQRMLKAYEESPDSFTVDTLYLNWNITFPGVTVCQVFNGERNWELCEKYYGEDRDKRLDDYIIDISFFSGTCYSCELCNIELDCPDNFTDIISKFRATCPDMITNCTWNDYEFDCCSFFLPLKTEFGTCFTLNSRNTEPAAKELLITNRHTGPGTIEFYLLEDVQIFIHPPDEVPHAFQSVELKQTVLWGTKKEIIIQSTETTDEDRTKPSCQAPTGFKLYREYTTSTCAIECHIQAQIRFCNCTHHFMPNYEESRGGIGNKKAGIVPKCTYKGLMCLTQNFADISRFRKECRCAPSCESTILSTVQESEEEQASDYGSFIRISQMQLPSLRYIKRHTKTGLNFIISFGGLLGLLFGISFISLMEFLQIIVVNIIKFIKWIFKWKK